MATPVSEEEFTDQEYGNLAFHPMNVILMLTIFGITVLFLAMTASFVYTRIQSDIPPIQIPSLFVVNTLILLGSSATMHWAIRSYKSDETEQYKQALLATLVLSIFFLIMQFVAWGQLFSNNIFIDTDNSAGYLYVISFLHFAHLIAGIPFLVVFYVIARKRMREPVSVLVYFSDPAKRLNLRLLAIYWHFLDGLWIYLILFFWVNWLFS